jgi:hypothetical protein
MHAHPARSRAHNPSLKSSQESSTIIDDTAGGTWGLYVDGINDCPWFHLYYANPVIDGVKANTLGKSREY